MYETIYYNNIDNQAKEKVFLDLFTYLVVIHVNNELF